MRQPLPLVKTAHNAIAPMSNYVGTSKCVHRPIHDTLHFQSHSCEDLVNFVRSNIQDIASADMSMFYVLYNVETHRPTAEIITEISGIFNQVFFANTLANKVYIHIRPEMAREFGKEGYSIRSRTAACHWDIVIFEDDGEFTTGRNRIERIIYVLAHEMLHCYFDYFLCYKCEKEGRKEITGLTGHGEAWVKVAWLVQGVLQDRKYFGMRGVIADLGIERSVDSEVAAQKAQESNMVDDK